MSKEMKPMGIGDVLDSTFSILRERFWSFQGVNFLSLLPLLVLGVLGVIFFSGTLVNLANMSTDEFLTGFLNTVGWGAVIFFIAFIVIGIRASINFVYGNINLFKFGLHGEFISATKAFKGVKGKRLRFVGAYIITALISLGWQWGMKAIMGVSPHDILTILYYVGIFLLNFFFYLVSVVLSMEDRGVFASLKRALTLPSSNRLRILLTLAIVYILVYVIAFILMGLIIAPIILVSRINTVLGVLVGFVLGIVFTLAMSIFSSFFYGPLTAIYYDLLVRKEGYDIKLRLSSVGSDLQSSTESL